MPERKLGCGLKLAEPERVGNGPGRSTLLALKGSGEGGDDLPAPVVPLGTNATSGCGGYDLAWVGCGALGKGVVAGAIDLGIG